MSSSILGIEKYLMMKILFKKYGTYYAMPVPFY